MLQPSSASAPGPNLERTPRKMVFAYLTSIFAAVACVFAALVTNTMEQVSGRAYIHPLANAEFVLERHATWLAAAAALLGLGAITNVIADGIGRWTRQAAVVALGAMAFAGAPWLSAHLSWSTLSSLTAIVALGAVVGGATLTLQRRPNGPVTLAWGVMAVSLAAQAARCFGTLSRIRASAVAAPLLDLPFLPWIPLVFAGIAIVMAFVRSTPGRLIGFFTFLAVVGSKLSLSIYDSNLAAALEPRIDSGLPQGFQPLRFSGPAPTGSPFVVRMGDPSTNQIGGYVRVFPDRRLTMDEIYAKTSDVSELIGMKEHPTLPAWGALPNAASTPELVSLVFEKTSPLTYWPISLVWNDDWQASGLAPTAKWQESNDELVSLDETDTAKTINPGKPSGLLMIAPRGATTIEAVAKMSSQANGREVVLLEGLEDVNLSLEMRSRANTRMQEFAVQLHKCLTLLTGEASFATERVRLDKDGRPLSPVNGVQYECLDRARMGEPLIRTKLERLTIDIPLPIRTTMGDPLSWGDQNGKGRDVKAKEYGRLKCISERDQNACRYSGVRSLPILNGSLNDAAPLLVIACGQGDEYSCGLQRRLWGVEVKVIEQAKVERDGAVRPSILAQIQNIQRSKGYTCFLIRPHEKMVVNVALHLSSSRRPVVFLDPQESYSDPIFQCIDGAFSYSDLRGHDGEVVRFSLRADGSK